MLKHLLTAALMTMTTKSMAVPSHPFPAMRSPVLAGDWPKTPLPNPPDTAPSQLRLGWDDENLTVVVESAGPANRLTLRFLTKDVTLAPSDEGLKVTGVEARGSRLDGPAGSAWEASLPWKLLGIAPRPGRVLPLRIEWKHAGGVVDLTGLPHGNIYTWGCFFLRTDEPLEDCAPAFGKPLAFRFDPGAATGKPRVLLEATTSFLPAGIEFLKHGMATGSSAAGATRVDAPAVIDLPAAEGAEAVGFRLSVAGYAEPGQTPEYRALPPGKPWLHFKGNAKWKEPKDFDAFWDRAKADLAKVPMNEKLTRVPKKDTPTGMLHRLEFDSLDGVRIVCWYYTPKAASAANRCPAVQVMPGYGAEEPPIDRTAEGIITLSVNPRGHGPSNEFWELPADHLHWNIEDANRYYYRGAYMDCYRALQWLKSRPEVDAARVAVEGSSQGGAFALATAALDGSIAGCAANVPFLTDLPTGALLTTVGGMATFRDEFASDSPQAKAVKRSLGYIDGRFMATRIKCPTLIAVGEMDRVCPPPCGVAAYNNLPKASRGELVLMQGIDHEIPSQWYEATGRWYRRVFGKPHAADAGNR